MLIIPIHSLKVTTFPQCRFTIGTYINIVTCTSTWKVNKLCDIGVLDCLKCLLPMLPHLNSEVHFSHVGRELTGSPIKYLPHIIYVLTKNNNNYRRAVILFCIFCKNDYKSIGRCSKTSSKKKKKLN